MSTLARYKLPLQPAPEPVLHAVSQGVRSASFEPVQDAQKVLGGAQAPANGVCRDPQGRVRITCVTDMPGVTPAMIDWWFGWHLPFTERYALWHPTAHLRSVVKEDRSHVIDDRGKYIGNVSYVDEYIGASLKRLAIAFVPPSLFGLNQLDARHATAICAYTSDRLMRGEGGCLVHYVLPTAKGSQMRSAFWLGEIRHHHALVDQALHGVLNSRLVRRLIVSDRMALDLLQHCGEEMNHLARFLPSLYADMNPLERSMLA